MSNFFVTTPIKIKLGQDVHDVKSRVAKLVGIAEKDLLSLQLKKQSVDARDKRDVHFVCSYVVECAKTSLRNATPYVEPADLLLTPPKFFNCGSCIVVGAGPAGLFLARYLTRQGVKVTLFERGSDVDARREKVEQFHARGTFDKNCNVQFGLGGAGTFSDGKLTTGISSPLLHTVFQEFARQGAPKSILTSALPHIGTDNLVRVVANMRDDIIRFGGEFRFDTFVSDLIVSGNKVVGVLAEQDGVELPYYADCVALCCGHSARETFSALLARGVEMQFKPFAVGLRVEHKREFINKAQYGELFATHRDLDAASYKLTHNEGSRSCYSFCMCPGGVVVPANSEEDSVVVNGMSNYARNAQNSNSALVVTVGEKDVLRYGYKDDVLAGMKFQQVLEKRAFTLGGGNYCAPCQNVTDFLRDTKSTGLDITPSYLRGVKLADMRDLLPQDIVQVIKNALCNFNKKIKGFAECGVLTGVETRTSSPVKILRDENMQANLAGLFPVGEGAGHAGGIVSSAVDGLKAAQEIVKFLNATI